jgi:hypothetical protein
MVSVERVSVILKEAGSPECGMRVVPFYPCQISLPESVPYRISDGNKILDTVLSDGHITFTQDNVTYTLLV